jgi:hypothetical protein
MKRLRIIRDYAAAHARNLLALASFITLTVGLAWAWLPLGLIVPSMFVFFALAWSHNRREPTLPSEPTLRLDRNPQANGERLRQRLAK